MDTPPKSRGDEGTSSRGVASIFSRKRIKLEDEPERDSGVEPTIGQMGNDRKRPLGKTQGVEKEQVVEKKPRVNPLLANQP
jgi:hypothetical protein